MEEFKIAESAPIEELGAGCFNGCSSLKTVELSNNLKNIGYIGFKDCVKLTAIDLKNVEEIGSSCFNGCILLKDFDFGNSIKYIRADALRNTAIESLTIPESCVEIEGEAFSDCENLKIFTAEGEFASGLSIFKNSYNIETLTFPSFNIGLEDAFGLDSFIEDYSVYVPNLTTLNVFGSKLRTNFGRNFSKLKNITLSDEVMESGQGCFINKAWYNNQPNGIVYLNKVVLGYKGEKPTGTITVKEGTTVISNSSFYNCSDITKVVLPQTLKCIGAFAFDGCNLSGELNMPESLQTIQNNAFYGCSNLTKVVFNNGLSSIGNRAFEGCNLTGEMVIPDSVKSLGTNCFKGNNGISKLTLSFVKDVIFLEMFYNIPTSLTEVVAKGSYLPDSAMQNSSNLRKVTLSNEITYIPKNALKDCYYLTEIYFGNITKIGDSAFMECKSLASFVMKDSVSEIGEKAFYGCSMLENITLGNGVKTIGNYVFANCISL